MSIYEENAAIRENMIAGSRDLLQSIVEARKGWPMHPDFNRFIWSGKDSASGKPDFHDDDQAGACGCQAGDCKRGS